MRRQEKLVERAKQRIDNQPEEKLRNRHQRSKESTRNLIRRELYLARWPESAAEQKV